MRKNVIITGSNRGIGRAMLEKFAANGYDVWACARRETEEFLSAIKNLSNDTGASITPIYFDLSDENEIRDGIKKILSEKKNIDVLINNAGVAYGGAFTMTPVKKMREIYEVNVFAQVNIMQLVARKMIRQNSGCIINMCSAAGIFANPGFLAYGSGKAALIWITKMAAKELGRYNIRVNGIAPSFTDTDMGHYNSEETIKEHLKTMALPPRMLSPREVADAAFYIASDSAAFLTGQILQLDGGGSA